VSSAEHAPLSAAEAQVLLADLAEVPGLVLAVSGGPDSTALLVVVARWRRALKRGPSVLAVTVDHRLRADSAREAARVKALARQLNVPHRTLRWTGDKPSTGIQEAARRARYALLAQAARRAGATHIVTAHTRDDQAETVLFRLVRGSGLTGLAAMARATPLDDIVVVRPLLDVPKARLIATLNACHLSYVDDPSNHDPRFARPRLRAIMAALAPEGLDAARLATLAGRVARADAALETATDEAMRRLCGAAAPNGRLAIAAAEFRALPDEIALRLIYRAITSAGNEGPVELAKLEALVAALRAADPDAQSARVRRTLAGALITLDHGQLVIERAPPRRNLPRKQSDGAKGPFTKFQ